MTECNTSCLELLGNDELIRMDDFGVQKWIVMFILIHFNIRAVNCGTTEILQEFCFLIILKLNVFAAYCNLK